MRLDSKHPRITNLQLQRLSWIVVCLICVSVIYFVPSRTGPFSCVRGPATAFQSVKKAAAAKSSIATAAARPSRSPAPATRAQRTRIQDSPSPVATLRDVLELSCNFLV
jgi:hypothetical protein